MDKIIKSKDFRPTVRAYTVQVPLPGIPTHNIALLARKDKQPATNIIETHKNFINLCDFVGIELLSLSSDGAANKLLAQMEILHLSNSHLTYIHHNYNIKIKIRFLGDQQIPLVGIQDPKHVHKTSVNQFLLGSCLLCFGNFWFSILH